MTRKTQNQMKGIGRRLEHKQKREKQQKECKVTGYQFQSKWRSIAGCRLLLRTLTSWKISLTLSFAKGFCELPFWLQFPGGVRQERHLSVYPHFALTVFTITHFTCCLWQIGEGSMDDVKKKIFLDNSYNTVAEVCRHLFDLKLLPT